MTTRRGFIRASAATGIGLAVSACPTSTLGAPQVILRKVKPTCIASANGLADDSRAIEELANGASTIEAAVRGVNLVEEDPQETSVGYGGLPNRDGVVQLDASLMYGPTAGAGAVAALEGIKRPSLVALDVMRHTNHVLLVGKGAQDFAISMGHIIENLLTEESRQRWIEWRAGLSDQDDYLTPEESAETVRRLSAVKGFGDGLIDSHDGVRPQGTINCDIVNRDGDLASVTTTSGLAFKIPGRVGDSPIIGAGQFCDNRVGAAGATGRGEVVIKTCGSHTIVELMRRGMHPKDACLEALRRIVHVTVERRLLRADNRPNFGVNFYAVSKGGEFGGAALYAGARYAVSVDGNARLEDSAYLFERP